jgi:hypothetical protein
MERIAEDILEWLCLKTVPCCLGISGLRILAEIGDSVLLHQAYLVVKSMHQYSDCLITKFYERKKNRGLSDKAAAVAASNKLLRVIYSVLAKKAESIQQ